MPLISVIIIDHRKANPYLAENFSALAGQSFKDFEVLLFTDCENDIEFKNLTKKVYGHYVGPAEKRDDAAKAAKGEILAFLDDDAFPDKNWLASIVSHFDDPQIAGGGGPGVTPPGVSWQEELSGWVSASPFGSGSYLYRFLPGKKQFVDDYPSMNLAIRKTDFEKVKGFDSHYWPGEDTKLCLDLVHKLGKKIIYDPAVLVYHHRRPLWRPHLRQNGNYGLHRGFFARILPKTSLKPLYLAPSLLLIYLFFSPILILDSRFYILYSLPLLVYLLLLMTNALWIYKKSHSIIQATLSIVAVPLTHLWYGARFLQGYFFTKKLVR